MTAQRFSNDELRSFIAEAQGRLMMALVRGDLAAAESWAWIETRAQARLAEQLATIGDARA